MYTVSTAQVLPVFQKSKDLSLLQTPDFCLSKTVFEIKHVESRKSFLKDQNCRLWVLHAADFYVLERPKTKSSSLKDRNLPCAMGFHFLSTDSEFPQIDEKDAH